MKSGWWKLGKETTVTAGLSLELNFVDNILQREVTRCYTVVQNANEEIYLLVGFTGSRDGLGLGFQKDVIVNAHSRLLESIIITIPDRHTDAVTTVRNEAISMATDFLNFARNSDSDCSAYPGNSSASFWNRYRTIFRGWDVKYPIIYFLLDIFSKLQIMN